MVFWTNEDQVKEDVKGAGEEGDRDGKHCWEERDVEDEADFEKFRKADQVYCYSKLIWDCSKLE